MPTAATLTERQKLSSCAHFKAPADLIAPRRRLPADLPAPLFLYSAPAPTFGRPAVWHAADRPRCLPIRPAPSSVRPHAVLRAYADRASDLSPQQAQALAETYSSVLTEHGAEVTRLILGPAQPGLPDQKNRKGIISISTARPGDAITELERQRPERRRVALPDHQVGSSRRAVGRECAPRANARAAYDDGERPRRSHDDDERPRRRDDDEDPAPARRSGRRRAPAPGSDDGAKRAPAGRAERRGGCGNRRASS
jgi:hypothetical protein